jgi:hypothetical protein
MASIRQRETSIAPLQHFSAPPPKDRKFCTNSVIPPIQRGDILDTNSEAVAPAATDDFSYSSKLTNVEAQRIMAVLQEMQKKVHLVGLIQDNLDKRTPSVLNGESYALVKVFADNVRNSR